MRKLTNQKNWRAAPLPFEFHLALDNNKWEDALKAYQLHPYHTAPADTYDLLKQIMYNTKAQVEVVKQRFNAKIKLAVNMQKRAPEEVEWATFWKALNEGDSKTISMALCGAKIVGVSQQIGVAEACAALLKSSNKTWHHDLVGQMPYSTVTKSNLVMTCLMRQRWDLACEMMRISKLTRPEVGMMWPVVEQQFSWAQGLTLLASCSKTAVPWERALPFILNSGCPLDVLSQHLEQLRVLGNVEVVRPLLQNAVDRENWDFVVKCVEHLCDIGTITPAAHRAFRHLCSQKSVGRVCDVLQKRGIPFHHLTVELLEEIKI